MSVVRVPREDALEHADDASERLLVEAAADFHDVAAPQIHRDRLPRFAGAAAFICTGSSASDCVSVFAEVLLRAALDAQAALALGNQRAARLVLGLTSGVPFGARAVAQLRPVRQVRRTIPD